MWRDIKQECYITITAEANNNGSLQRQQLQ